MNLPFLPQQLLVIDIDGLRQDVFHQALSENRIPNLGKLLRGPQAENGVHLDPVSTAPSITFCAQSSIFTGTQPHMHHLPGNQFFDRFGLNNGKPRFYAFDVGDDLAYDDAVLTFTGEIGLLGQALNPSVATLYELAAQRGLNSTVVYHMVSRGATRWIRPNLADIARFTKGGGMLAMSAEQYDSEMMEKALEALRTNDFPDLMTVYFMGLDHTSHHEGPASQLDYLARVVDPLIGRLVSELDRQGRFAGMLVAIVSDHGHIQVVPDDRHSLRLSFPFDREMGYLFDALGLDVNDKPGEGPASDAVVASNGGLAHVYIRRGAGDRYGTGAWSDLPHFSKEVLPVGRAFWDAHATGRYAPDMRGALTLVLARSVEQEGWETGYQALTPEGSLLPLEEFLEGHPEIQVVDAIPRLRALAGPLSGDLLLISNYAEGFYFGSPMQSVHGGLHPQDSLAVASLGWTGATSTQWAHLRQTAEQMIAARQKAESRRYASVADTLHILTKVMGWE